MPRFVALLLPALVGAVIPAGAQPVPRFAVEGGGVYTTLRAEDLYGVGRGAGVDVQARMMFTALSLGVGVLRSSHYVERMDGDFSVSGIFVEPRYSLAPSSRVSLFISGTMGRMTRRFAFRPTSFDRDGSLSSYMVARSGISIGGGGGVEVAVGSFARVNASAVYTHLSFRPVDGSALYGPDVWYPPATSGSRVTLRTGMAFVLGPR